ncbi:MAG: DUF4116 domain-containing protein [Clostridia bacterium]
MIEKRVQEIMDNNDDREFIMEAVKENGVWLEWASERLRDDKEVVLEAISNDRRGIRICK